MYKLDCVAGRHEDNPIVLAEVKGSSAANTSHPKGRYQKPHKGARASSPVNTGRAQARTVCRRFGKDHPKGKCPAISTTCNKCNRKGHYASVCFSKTVTEIAQADEGEFLGSVHDMGVGSLQSCVPR